MSNQHISDEFLAKVHDAYQSSHPLFLEVLQEQKQLKTYWAMFRAALEINGDENAEQFIEAINTLLEHLDKMAGIIAVHDGVAMMVNAVMREHEE